MKKIFKSKSKTIQELLKESKVCNTINDIVFKDGKAYLNPYNQKCFNYGTFTEQDFLDWLDGKGKIIKGKDDEEKKKIWEYALFESEYKHGYLITMNYKHFYLVSSNYKRNYNKQYDYNSKFKPIVFDGNNHADFISNIFGNYVVDLLSDFISVYNDGDYNRIRKDWNETSWGIKKTLMLMGIGYAGAVNTPEEIENLTWFSDIVFSKAYYLHLKEHKNVKFPDFDFFENYKNKI